MKAYRLIALLIAVEVVIQAMAIAFAVFGQKNFVLNDGGVVDKALIDSQDADFVGVIGFPIHAINGMLIGLLALVLLITSFFAKVPGGLRAAAVILGLVLLQIFLGTAGGDVPALGLLHGLNAFAIMLMALAAARRASSPAAPAP